MTLMRKMLWMVLAASAAALVSGLALLGGAVLSAGDWLLAPQPWSGVGLALITVGLGGGAVASLALDLVEPIGVWRLLAVPPALLVGAFWAFALVVGLPTSGGPEFDVPTVLYTQPMVMVVLVVLTVALALPAVAGRLARGHRGATAA